MRSVLTLRGAVFAHFERFVFSFELDDIVLFFAAAANHLVDFNSIFLLLGHCPNHSHTKPIKQYAVCSDGTKK